MVGRAEPALPFRTAVNVVVKRKSSDRRAMKISTIVQITVLRCVVARSDRAMAVGTPSGKDAQSGDASLVAIVDGAVACRARARLNRCARLDETGRSYRKPVTSNSL
jgi:hypothetical protein